MKKEKVSFVTVGKLLQELKEYEDQYWDLCIACRISDDEEDSILCIAGSELDDEGDLCLHLAERDFFDEDDGYYDVADLIAVLHNRARDSKVYLAGCGLLLSFDLNGDGTIFDGVNEDDDTIGCGLSAFGEYEETLEEEPALVRKRDGLGEDIALVILTLLGLSALAYNVYGLVTRSGSALWEHVIWIAAGAVVVLVCGLTLFNSMETKKTIQ